MVIVAMMQKEPEATQRHGAIRNNA